jgi:uncharacterized membrane-anchored protein
MTEAEFELMVKRCLSNGVPVGVVAQVFELDRETVAEAKKELLVTEYGTADLAEFREHLEWKTLDKCRQILDTGSPAEAARIATTVLGRQIARGAKTISDGQREAQQSLAAKMEAMRTGDPAPAPKPSSFVVGSAVHDG